MALEFNFKPLSHILITIQSNQTMFGLIILALIVFLLVAAFVRSLKLGKGLKDVVQDVMHYAKQIKASFNSFLTIVRDDDDSINSVKSFALKAEQKLVQSNHLHDEKSESHPAVRLISMTWRKEIQRKKLIFKNENQRLLSNDNDKT